MLINGWLHNLAVPTPLGLLWLYSHNSMSAWTPHMPKTTLYSVQCSVQCTLHCTITLTVPRRKNYIFDLIPQEHTLLASYTLHITLYYSNYWTLQCILYCVLNSTLYCTLYFTLYYTQTPKLLGDLAKFTLSTFVLYTPPYNVMYSIIQDLL